MEINRKTVATCKANTSSIQDHVATYVQYATSLLESWIDDWYIKVINKLMNNTVQETKAQFIFVSLLSFMHEVL